MIPQLSDENREKIWSWMDACRMVMFASFCLTAAIAIPFLAFGSLHKAFCQ